MTKVAEHLPSKYEAPSSNPSATKRGKHKHTHKLKANKICNGNN
jgi:hypothetical protein